jgi:hypothetical protein
MLRQYVGTAAVGIGYTMAAKASTGYWSVGSADSGTRQALYISLAASSGALLGFAITAVSILVTLGDGPRITWLRQQDAFAQTRVVFMTAIRGLGIATLLYTALILLDDGNDVAAWLQGLIVAVFVLVVVRLGWLVWLLNQLVSLATEDRKVSRDHIVPFSEPPDQPAGLSR